MQYKVLSVTCFCAIISFVFAEPGELNDGCSHIQDCRNFGYYCSANWTCQCLPGEYVPNKHRDRCLGLINKRCKYDEHCIEGGYCKEQKKCTCKEGLYASEYDTKCSSSSRSKSAEIIEFTALLVLFMYLFKIL